MPPKKNTAVQKASGDSGPVLMEGSDPVQTAVAIIDKKVRNLEKRKVSKFNVRRVLCVAVGYSLPGNVLCS